MEITELKALRKLIASNIPFVTSIDQETLRRETANTLGIKREIIGVAYPSDVQEVIEIVKMAHTHGVALYPISKGKNIGYGDKAPLSDNQLIVSLEKMDRIREFDEVQGHVILEPGVTQNVSGSAKMHRNRRFENAVSKRSIYRWPKPYRGFRPLLKRL
jgi:FAD/FMN-containing dehydrogenase